MSAYVVHPDTIDLIVSFATRGGSFRRMAKYHTRRAPETYPDRDVVASVSDSAFGHDLGPDAIAQILWEENHRSVNYRYTSRDEVPGFVFHRVHSDDYSALTVLASIRCLRYQSCECPDYDQTAACALLDEIESHAIRAITEGEPWGWTRAYRAEQVAAAKAKVAAMMTGVRS